MSRGLDFNALITEVEGDRKGLVALLMWPPGKRVARTLAVDLEADYPTAEEILDWVRGVCEGELEDDERNRGSRP
jgi:hypothetical protein